MSIDPLEAEFNPRGSRTIIVPHESVSSARLEVRVLEAQRDRLVYAMLLFGAVVLLVGVMW